MHFIIIGKGNIFHIHFLDDNPYRIWSKSLTVINYN